MPPVRITELAGLAAPQPGDLIPIVDTNDTSMSNQGTTKKMSVQALLDALGSGSAGASAYQIAVANGFVGSESDWLLSLVGDAGQDGEDGDTGPPGPALGGAGTLAARPAAGSVPDGFSYWATDDDGGREWRHVSGAWAVGGPSVNSAGAGQIVTRVAPTSNASVTTVANTPTRVTSLTTPTFAVPPNAVVEYSGFIFLGHGATAVGQQVADLQLRWSSDSWATSNLIWTNTVTDPGTSPLYMATSTPLGPAMLPPAGQVLAVGTNVQVALFAKRTDVKTLTIVSAVANAVNPYIAVRAG